MIEQRIGPTLSLMAVTLCLSVVVAVPMGVLAAWKAGSWIDRLIMGFAVFGFSVPVFVVGYLLAYVFALGACHVGRFYLSRAPNQPTAGHAHSTT
jgi:peptide/nickel transport system permease protein